MKKRLFCFIIIPMLTSLPIGSISTQYVANFEPKTECCDTTVYTIVDNWEIFTEAVMYVESRFNDSIENGIYVGCLQISPICVKEVNRILGEEVYSLDSRYSRDSSVAMWNIIQDRYNRSHDIDTALNVWNPKHKKSYRDAVMEYYNSHI